MRLIRVLKYLNLLIGLGLLILIAAVYRYVWRPLPKTSGELSAPVSQAATVTRDENGVAHIRAASIEDALFLQGFVTAQDRMWQMDVMRRVASGDLSEVIGARSLELDREARRLRVRRLAEEHARRLPPEDRKWVAAYTRGVNHYLETHRSKLPVEFTLLRYTPRPWTVADTIAIGMQMYRDLTTTWKADLGKAAMLSKGDANLVAQLFPPRTGMEMQVGSNAWAIAGKRTASGKPLLANDPHLEWNFPSTWYMIDIEAPGLHAAGSALPGVPGVVIGHNDRIAWAATNLEFDVQDLYIEKLDPRTGQYVFEGKVEQAQLDRELIPVKDARPVEFTNWVTRHGPVWTTTGIQSLTLRWAAAEPGALEFAVIDINRARNWQEFRTAIRRWHGPGQNFVYADVDGNIGYQATGSLPIRKGFAGDLPIPGDSGQYEWAGFVPFEELPSAFNPPDGLIVSANQNPFPPNWPYPVNGNFEAGFRVRQIRALLGARSGWKPEEMIPIQEDVYSEFLHSLAQQVVTSVRDPNAAEAVNLLRNWNGQMEKGQAAPMIAQLFYQEMRRRLAERASPAGAASYVNSYAPVAVLNIVRERRSGWFDDWDKTITEGLLAALEEGRRTQGRDIAKWDYGQWNAIDLRHPVVSQVPYLGRYFNIGRVPMSGSSNSVKQTTNRVGPSMRFVADMSDWNRSLNNVMTGQSGHILSSHYKDQWDEYWSARGLPMHWTNVQGDTLRFVPAR